MKIAFVSTEKLPVPAAEGGAVQTYIEGVLPCLSKRYDITVFCGAGSGRALEEKKGNVRYVRIPGAKPGQYIETVKSRLDRSFDLVHIFNRPLWLLSLSEGHPKLAYSLSLHNDMFHPDRMTKSEALECAARARFITAVSKYTADMAIAHCPAVRDKIHVIYSGVDAGRYSPASAVGRHSQVPAVGGHSPAPDVGGHSSAMDVGGRSPAPDAGVKDSKTILFVGRLTPEKGAHVLMQAVKKIMEERDGITLVIAGSRRFGSNEGDDYTRSLKALSGELKGSVVFTGFMQPDKLIDYYRSADIFVCPSQWNEPLARVLYEAMASRLPVVATDRGGNAEVVSNFTNGILVSEYRSHNAIAKAIRLLLDDPKKAEEMGKAGLELVMANHSWERVAEDIRRMIDKHVR